MGPVSSVVVLVVFFFTEIVMAAALVFGQEGGLGQRVEETADGVERVADPALGRRRHLGHVARHARTGAVLQQPILLVLPPLLALQLALQRPKKKINSMSVGSVLLDSDWYLQQVAPQNVAVDKSKLVFCFTCFRVRTMEMANRKASAV